MQERFQYRVGVRTKASFIQVEKERFQSAGAALKEARVHVQMDAGQLEYVVHVVSSRDFT